MGFTTLNLGIQLTLPTNGTRNWGTTLRNTTWTKISSHDHSGSGNGTQLGSTALVDNAITSAKLAKNIATFQRAATLTPIGTAQTVNFDEGTNQKITLASATGDVTLTLSNPQTGALYTIIVIQGATPRDLIWPSEVKWPQGQKPILSIGNGDIDKIRLYYDGSIYLCDWDIQYS